MLSHSTACSKYENNPINARYDSEKKTNLSYKSRVVLFFLLFLMFTSLSSPIQHFETATVEQSATEE